MVSRNFEKDGPRAWVIWSLSVIAFGYAFFQRVSPSAMVSDLMRDFQASGTVLGHLSALYFYPYVVLQVPLGILLDHIGARILISVSLSVAGIGSLMFATSESLEIAYFSRLLIGLGCASGFIGSLALSARWFAPERFALLTGLCMFFAMMSGIAGQAPLASLVAVVGWRWTVNAMGIFALVLALAVYLVVRNAPTEGGRDQRTVTDRRPFLWSSVTDALLNREVWLISIVATSFSGPMLAFGGLWGVPYLMEAYDLSRPVAAMYTSTLFLGWACGAPFMGWISDRIGRRKAPLVLAAALVTALGATFAVIPNLPLPAIVGVITILGFAGSSMVITFAYAREVTPASIHGAALGIVNGMTVASGAILQPVIGALLDGSWDGTMVEGARYYSADGFRQAFLSLPIWTGIGFLATLCLRETNCQPNAELVLKRTSIPRTANRSSMSRKFRGNRK